MGKNGKRSSRRKLLPLWYVRLGRRSLEQEEHGGRKAHKQEEPEPPKSNSKPESKPKVETKAKPESKLATKPESKAKAKPESSPKQKVTEKKVCLYNAKRRGADDIVARI